jgi:hypothetical protein
MLENSVFHWGDMVEIFSLLPITELWENKLHVFIKDQRVVHKLFQERAQFGGFESMGL